jgi:hypothetical protein
LPTGDAVYTSEGVEDIAYANDWVPLGWLALFETGDVRMVSGAESEDQTPPCATLLTRKDLELEATVGKNLREIHFPFPDLIRAAISGYVSDWE